MHTGAGACNSNIKKLQKDDLLLIETQFVVMGKFRNYGCLMRNGCSDGPNCVIIMPKV